MIVALLLLAALAAPLPDTPDAVEAVRLYGELDYEAAEPLFRDIATRPAVAAPSRATAWLWVALCQAGLGNNDGATDAMHEAFALDADAALPAEVGPTVQKLFDDNRAQHKLTASTAPVDVPATAPVATVTPAAGGPKLFGGAAGFGLSIRADIAMMNGRTFGVTASSPELSGAAVGDGIQGFGGGVLLQAAWHLPLEGSSLDRVFGVELDVGYALSGTNGEVAVQQYESVDGQTRLVTTTYAYEGLLHSVPFSLGLRARLPLDLPLHIDVAAGGLGLWGMSTTTSTVVGAGAAFSQDNTATDFAWGYYLEPGIALALGIGELTAAYRYQSAFLDFEHPDFNPSPGDLGGHHLLIGYRFLL